MPTTEDYIDVATVITHIKQLRNCMKERRKTPRKNRSATQTTDKKLEQPKKPMTSGTLIQVPPGEDKTSFERHNRLLSMEYTRPKRTRPLMKVSYAMRRNDILENGHTFSIIEKYPISTET